LQEIHEMTAFADYPDDAYLRVFNAARRLSEAEVARIGDAMRAFQMEWVAHEQPVTSAFDLVHDQFLVVATDPRAVQLSGCAKDALVGFVWQLGAELAVELVHSPPLCFRKGDDIVAVDRATFGDLVERGEITGDTIVFDNTVHAVGPYRAGRWELPARDCWHAQAWEAVAS